MILNKEVIGAILVFRDFSREDKIDQAKTEFVSLASHQLRAPLSIINWHCEALVENQAGFSPKQKKYLENIVQATKRMTNLVRELLNTSRLEMGTFRIETKELDLIGMVNDIVDELRPRSETKGVSVEKKFSEKNCLSIVIPN